MSLRSKRSSLWTWTLLSYGALADRAGACMLKLRHLRDARKKETEGGKAINKLKGGSRAEEKING